MAALLVSLGVMAVLLTLALPSWRQMMQREKEAELVWRGEQYARAVGLFQRKFAGAFAPSVDVLVTQKFLRKKYKDPMIPDGEFQVLYQAGAGQRPGQLATPGMGGTPGLGAGDNAETPRPGISVDDDAADSDQPAGVARPGTAIGTVGPRGGVIGVVSKSTKQGMRLYNGRSRYNEWQFLYTQVSTGAGAPGAGGPVGGPGAGRPGGPGGSRGPGGPGGASRPGMMQPTGPGRPPFGSTPGAPGSIGVGRPTGPGGPPQ